MRKEHQYKKPGAEERERAHQFGQPNGNKAGGNSIAINQREFYRWVEAKATEEELKAYVADKTNPYIRRKFVIAFQNANNIQDYIALTNQTHGQPKQIVEVQDLPVIHCEVFGDKA